MLKGKDLATFFILFIISLLLCLDLFMTPGKPTSFDGLIHMSNIAQYHNAINDGDFPVRWLGRMANYGMPIPLFSQQTIAYAGAFLMFFFNNTVFTYNCILLIFAFLSCVYLYRFLREYVSRWSALVGTFLFCFAPYRIINIYIRGAAPEFAASLFLPFILFSMKKWIVDRQYKYYFSFILGVAMLFLTHPISAIVFLFILAPYYASLIWLDDEKIKNTLLTLLGGGVAMGVASFYLIPLMMEFKYLYYGLGESVFLPNSYLDLQNILNPGWFYFYNGDILTRGHYLHLGVMEVLVVLIGFIILISKLLKGKKASTLSLVLYFSFIVYMILLTKLGTPIFHAIKILGNVQHQWRILAGIIFIPPIILALTLDKFSRKIQILIGTAIIIAVVILRFPQLYGKNYVVTDEKTYFSSKDNLYAQVMNTIWTGPTQDYPVKKQKGEIISGKGVITSRDEHNSWRRYAVMSKTELRLVDNTFYFPGWKVFVDGKETPIEFQDMNYRGVITYSVPQGQHEILVKFMDTKVRLLANAISLFSISVLGILFMMREKLFRHPSKKGA